MEVIQQTFLQVKILNKMVYQETKRNTTLTSDKNLDIMDTLEEMRILAEQEVMQEIEKLTE